MLIFYKLSFEIKQFWYRYGDIYCMWNFGTLAVSVQKFPHVEIIHKQAEERSLWRITDIVGYDGIIFGKYKDPNWKKLRKVMTINSLKQTNLK